MADWLGPAFRTLYRLDDDGNLVPDVGGTLQYFIPGTDDAKDTWKDPEESEVNSNPITLDEHGQCQVFGSGLYREVYINGATPPEPVWDKVVGNEPAEEPGPDTVYVTPSFEVFGDPPGISEILGSYIFLKPAVIPADWDGTPDGFPQAQGWQFTAPADDDVVITVERGTVGSATLTALGTITVEMTTGDWTWETEGHLPQSMDAYSFAVFSAPVTPDSAWKNIFFTFYASVILGMSYTMEAVENWDATHAAEFAADTFPESANASQMLLGRGYDPVRRNIMYILGFAEVTIGTNDTGFTIFDGYEAAVTSGAALNYTSRLNCGIGVLDIDTKVATRFDAYDPTSMVPNGIGGSDGTWRRFVGSSCSPTVEQYPLITDPQNGDVWFHVSPTCRIYNLRLADDYGLTISPLQTSSHFELVGITDDWIYVDEYLNAGPPNFQTLLVPRVRTSDEIAADYLLSYAEFDAPNAINLTGAQLSDCHLPDGRRYCFVVDMTNGAHWDFALYELTPPTSAPFGGPVVGGGWATVTPWAAATGPNTLASGYTNNSKDNTTVVAMALKQTSEVVLLSVYNNNGDPDLYSIGCTYYKADTAAWDHHEAFVTGYMDADWQPVATLAEAAWVMAFEGASGKLNTGIRPLDTWRDTNSYDYTADIPSDDDRLRWFWFDAAPTTAPDDWGDYRGLLVQYRFVYGSAPEVVQIIDAAVWDALYPDYAVAIGNDNIVEYSQSDAPYYTHIGNPMAKDCGVSDVTTGAFWFCGQNTNWFQFDPDTFANREANDINPPFMRLSFTSAPVTGRRTAQVTVSYIRVPAD